MKNSGLSAILLPLLTALAIYLSSGSLVKPPETGAKPSAPALPTATATATPKPNSKPAPGAGLQCPAAEYLLRSFFGLAVPESFKCVSTSPNQNDLLESLGQWQLDFLIATLPDPRDTRLDYLFDRHLDAIQRALEVAGYVYDRNWLPWLEEKRTDDLTASERYRSTPGVLLLRSRSVSKKILLLFLVGETPTAGIHKPAFRDALAQLRSIHEAGGSVCTANYKPLLHQIRVLGPTFSGSADSLAFVVRGQPHIFKLISGSATAFPKDRFHQLSETNERQASFSATVIEDKLAQQIFLKYLQELAGSPFLSDCHINSSSHPCIAVLSETSTAYGGSFRQTAASGLAPSPSPSPSPSPGLSPNASPSPTPSILQLTFPFHISQLRTEAEKFRAAHPKISVEVSFGKKNALPLPLDGSGEPRDKDVVPPFSQDEAVSAQIILEGLLAQIKRERIRYVGLLSTDVRDRVFLTHELASHCPNTVIFTYGNEAIYLHETFNLDFRGSLVITPYPLFALNQHWTYPFRGDTELITFSTQFAQGWYNATLALLDQPDCMLEYGEPFTQPAADRRYPALWLSVVGRHEFWPVKLLTTQPASGSAQQQAVLSADEWKQLESYTYNAANSNKTKCAKQGSPEQSNKAVNAGAHSPLLLMVLLALSLIPLFILLRRSFQPRSHRIWSAQHFSPDTEHPGTQDELMRKLDFRRRNYLYAAVISLLTFSLPVALLPLRTGLAESRLPVANWVWALTISALLLALVMLVWLFVKERRWFSEPKDVRIFRCEGAFILVTSFVLLLLAILAAQCDKSPSEKLFFYLRATELASGVSPLLPLMLLSLAAYASFFFRLRLTSLAEEIYSLPEPSEPAPSEQFKPFLDFRQGEPPSSHELRVWEYRVKWLLICRAVDLPWAWPMILGLILWCGYIFSRLTPSVEGRSFDWYFMLAFLFVSLTFVLAILRFFALWRTLRWLLLRLAEHPLFSSLTPLSKAEQAALPKVDRLVRPLDYTALAFSIEQAKRFLRLFPQDAPLCLAEEDKEFSTRLKAADFQLSEAIQYETQREWWKSLMHFQQAQAKTSELARLVARTLEPHWYGLTEKEQGNEKDDQNGRENRNKKWIEQGRFFLISHVVTFLQYIIVHLQHLIGSVTLGFLLMLLAVNSYPFQPREPLLLFSWITILLVVALTFWVFIALSRDRVLSLLSGTTPGQLDLNSKLIVRILLHGVVPIIAILGAQFPETLQRIISWLTAFDGGGQ